MDMSDGSQVACLHGHHKADPGYEYRIPMFPSRENHHNKPTRFS